jgi:limonene-1,2-epoxide hydrolase
VLATDVAYDCRLTAIAAIENRKIVRWRGYMDSLAAWTALNKSVRPQEFLSQTPPK